jgi:hypothetical protein
VGHVHYAFEVYTDAGPQLLEIRFGDWSPACDASVVYENVDTAERREDLIGHLSDRILIGHVGWNHQRFAVYLSGDRVHTPFAACHERYRTTRVGKSLCRGLADPGRGSRDNGGPASQVHKPTSSIA